MRVFVTGASGWIGSAVVRDLLDAKHQVLGLARSDKSADLLTSIDPSVSVQRGSLSDLSVLKDGASKSDATIHLGFNHDFTQFEKSAAEEKAAVETITSALAGTDKPFLFTSGTLAVEHSQLAHEDTPDNTQSWNPRAAAASMVRDLCEKGELNGTIIRLCPTNYGNGDEGFIAILTNTARKNGKAAYLAEGANVWPANHRLDTAKLYVKALEYAAKHAKGVKVWHAVGDKGVSLKDISNVIGEKLKVPVESVDPEEAKTLYGPFFSMVIGMDNPVSSEKTRKELGWKPSQKGLLEDMKEGHYFEKEGSKYDSMSWS